LEVLAARDFFTVEIWTKAELVTYYVLTFMRLPSSKVCIAGATISPESHGMEQVARNLTMAGVGLRCGCRYLLQNRDAKFCAGFDAIFAPVGIEVLKLAPRSPKLNGHRER
jgi:hypothetical protein